ncbi:MAG: cation:proton antiporter [Thaumarchaeota archaeon]|nr:cation:proton antiporter [Nitrososphaerota archaeon]
MIVAAIMIAITYRLKQPMLIGYLLAGMIIGPFTPPFSLISSVDTINTLAELGIIMLLFVVGTEFPITKLRAVGRISILTAMLETVGTLLIVFFIAQNLGFPFFDAMFLALALSITSTVVTIRVLEDLGLLKDQSSILLLGISIVEDVIAISILGMLQSVATLTSQASIFTILLSVGIVGAFIGTVLTVGSKFVPKIIDKVAQTNDRALLLILILGFAFGLSFVAKGFGVSVATGAFLAGVLVAESKNAQMARNTVVPLRDMFAAIFFISIGALMDVALIPSFLIPAIVFILTSFSAKFLIVTGVLVKAGYDHTTSLKTGLGMSGAKGELSLAVVKGGADVGAITLPLLPILGAITIITTFITPYIIRLGSKLNTPSTADTES